VRVLVAVAERWRHAVGFAGGIRGGGLFRAGAWRADGCGICDFGVLRARFMAGEEYGGGLLGAGVHQGWRSGGRRAREAAGVREMPQAAEFGGEASCGGEESCGGSCDRCGRAVVSRRRVGARGRAADGGRRLFRWTVGACGRAADGGRCERAAVACGACACGYERGQSTLPP
jgi:hypothetical protein